MWFENRLVIDSVLLYSTRFRSRCCCLLADTQFSCTQCIYKLHFLQLPWKLVCCKLIANSNLSILRFLPYIIMLIWTFANCLMKQAVSTKHFMCIFRMTKQRHLLIFKEFLKHYCQVLVEKRFLIFGGMLSMCKHILVVTSIEVMYILPLQQQMCNEQYPSSYY